MPSRAFRSRRLSIAAVVTTLAAVALTIARPPLLNRLDNDLYDALTRSAGREPPGGRVVIVDIDEQSLADIGQWPWPRDVVARLIERIRAGGAAAVALDIVFPERDRETRSLQQGSPGPGDSGTAPPTATDAALADTLRQGRVVVGYAMTFDEGPPRRPCVLHPLRAARVQTGEARPTRWYRASGAICTLPLLAEAAGASGFLNAAPDPDGVLRRVPLVIEWNERLYPSLSLAAVLAMTTDREIDLRVGDAQTNWLTFGDRTVPLDGYGNVLVRFLGPDRTFAYVSASDVLAGRTAAASFAGKLVFVGATALGTQEDIATPVQALFPGVEIQATVAESLLAGYAVRRAGYASFAEGLLILLGIPVVWLVSRAGVLWAAGLVAALCALLWFGAGRLFAHGLFASPLLGMAGVATAYIATVIARLREERKLQTVRADEAARAAAEAENVTHQVLRKTSHELRTPLTVIAGWAHLIGIGALSDRQKNAALATIRENVRAQTRLIEDLVDASRVSDDGGVLLDLRPVDVRDVARPLVAHYAGVLEGKGVRFETAIDTVPCIVAGDAARLHQILDALLSNAARFTPGGRSVSARIARTHEHVEMAVSDTGIGIAPEFLPHVFERFRQEHDTTPDPRGGLGLGLTIARQLVELHGGSITVVSEGENRGATFVVWLPAEQ